MSTPPVILVLGPTAGGKTRLAVELALRLRPPGECLGADSMQIYRGMNIGTAKPTPEERAAVPYHLVDLVDPADDGFTVDSWLRACDDRLLDLQKRDRTPIIVGGTNLYIQAFLHGFAHGPAPDPGRRRDLETWSDDALRRRLHVLDPVAAKDIHPNDRKRTLRAIEIVEATGCPLAAVRRQWERLEPRPHTFIVGLEYDRETINRRINQRVRAMMEAGFRQEVEALAAGGGLGRQAREALGYKQLLAVVRGGASEAEAVEQIKIRTRQYAKQQRTWLKRFRGHRPSCWLHPGESGIASVVDEAVGTVQAWLDEIRQAVPRE